MQEIKTNPTVRHTTPLQLLAAFAATVAVLFVLLLGACALPAQPVLEHVYDSAQTIQQEGLYPEYFGFKLFQMDNYTDTIMLFEAAAMGEQDPLTAMMTATAYNVDNFETMAGDLAVYCERTIPLATGAQKAVHLVPFSYARYWHGYLIWLRRFYRPLTARCGNKYTHQTRRSSGNRRFPRPCRPDRRRNSRRPRR